MAANMHTTIGERKGMPYGGMPYSALLKKMATTRLPSDGDTAPEDDFRDFVRGEIIDRRPDPPSMEADTVRRDPALSKIWLNLRQNGTRGSRPELPRHPEMMWGFVGNDPRGASTDPRFDKVRGHIAARAGNLQVRMGNNDDNAVNERPWTAQSISYARKEILRRVRDSTKVFTAQKEGRPTGRNMAFNMNIAGENRRRMFAEGGEGVIAARGAHGALTEGKNDGVRRVDRRADADTAPWRHTTADAEFGDEKQAAAQGRQGAPRDTGKALRQAKMDGDLGVQRYSADPGRHGALGTQKASGGAASRVSVGDQERAAQMAGAGVPRTTLAASMSLAIKSARSRRLATADADFGAQKAAGPAGRSAPLPATASKSYRAQSGDALHAVQPPSVLDDAGRMARGLRESSASGKRRAMAAAQMSGARHMLPEETPAAGKHGPKLLTAQQQSSIRELRSQKSTTPIAVAAAAGLEVQNYRKSVQSKFKSHTMHKKDMEANLAEDTFARDHEVLHNSAGPIPKRLRGNEAGEEITRRDENGLEDA